MPCLPMSVKKRFERCKKHVEKQGSSYSAAAVCNKSVLAPYRKGKTYKKCMAIRRKKGLSR